MGCDMMMKKIKSVNEVSGFRFNDKKIEKIINDEMIKVDGYKKCNLYVEEYKKNGISGTLNIVLMFNYLYELANDMDNCMEDIPFILYSNLSKDFYIINIYILWK